MVCSKRVEFLVLLRKQNKFLKTTFFKIYIYIFVAWVLKTLVKSNNKIRSLEVEECSQD